MNRTANKKELKSLKTSVQDLSQTCDEQLSHIEDVMDTPKLNNKQCTHLKGQNEQLRSSNKYLGDYVARLEKSFLPKKSIDEISDSNHGRLLRKLGSQTEAALWFSEEFGLTPRVIKCGDKDGQTASVPLGSKTDYNSLESNDKQRLRELLYIPDKFAVSDATYYELSAYL